MALYRTYRPARLDEVVGQEHVTVPLARALEHDRIHHAYLFSGPRGCGKTSTARILARSLNCEQGPTPNPCGECRSCLDLAPNGPGSIDVIELDAASHGSVQDTRDLRERAMFAPVSSRYKIYIIDEAHMVSREGFNALLKLVEEPPEHVRFIFATTEAEKVIATIRSRTHNYAFRLVPTAELVALLGRVCAAEGVAVEPAALALVARAGAGSVRDSLSVLGQVIAGAGPAGVTYAEAAQQLGVTDAALLDDLVTALAARDGAGVFDVIERAMALGHDPRRFVSDLLERLRNLIVLQHVPGAIEAGLLDAPADELARQAEQAAAFGAGELSRAADIVTSTLSDLKGATAPRLQLELMAARLLLPSIDDGERGMRARLDVLERQVAAGPIHAAAAAAAPATHAAPAADQGAEPAKRPARKAGAPPRKLSQVAPSTADSAAESSPESSPESIPDATAPAPKPAESSSISMGIPELRSLWPAILEALKGYGRVAWIAFADSAPLSLNDRTLAVGIREQGKVANITAGKHDERLRQAILDVARIDVRVEPVFAPDVTSAASVPAAAGRAGVAAGAAAAGGAPSDESDVPSTDDENLDDSSGVDLAMQALGATTIGEIEH